MSKSRLTKQYNIDEESKLRAIQIIDLKEHGKYQNEIMDGVYLQTICKSTGVLSIIEENKEGIIKLTEE